MIVCDNCNVCVTKHAFCSDKCRVSYHRSKPSNASVTPVSIKEDCGMDGCENVSIGEYKVKFKEGGSIVSRLTRLCQGHLDELRGGK